MRKTNAMSARLSRMMSSRKLKTASAAELTPYAAGLQTGLTVSRARRSISFAVFPTRRSSPSASSSRWRYPIEKVSAGSVCVTHRRPRSWRFELAIILNSVLAFPSMRFVSLVFVNNCDLLHIRAYFVQVRRNGGATRPLSGVFSCLRCVCCLGTSLDLKRVNSAMSGPRVLIRQSRPMRSFLDR